MVVLYHEVFLNRHPYNLGGARTWEIVFMSEIRAETCKLVTYFIDLPSFSLKTVQILEKKVNRIAKYLVLLLFMKIYHSDIMTDLY